MNLGYMLTNQMHMASYPKANDGGQSGSGNNLVPRALTKPLSTQLWLKKDQGGGLMNKVQHLLLGDSQVRTANYACMGTLDVEYAAYICPRDLHSLLLALDDLQLCAPVFILTKLANSKAKRQNDVRPRLQKIFLACA
jgi:hypothetical protein